MSLIHSFQYVFSNYSGREMPYGDTKKQINIGADNDLLSDFTKT